MNVADELQKLQQLHQAGAITDGEYSLAKAKILGGQTPGGTAAVAAPELAAAGSDELEQETRHWGLILHLSIFAGFAVPIAGLIVPIIIWQLKKDELPGIDVHGKNAVNWIISKIIYVLVCVPLVLVVIGIPLLIALGIVAIIFPIVAAIKANNGEYWKYPLAITFFK